MKVAMQTVPMILRMKASNRNGYDRLMKVRNTIVFDWTMKARNRIGWDRSMKARNRIASGCRSKGQNWNVSDYSSKGSNRIAYDCSMKVRSTTVSNWTMRVLNRISSDWTSPNPGIRRIDRRTGSRAHSFLTETLIFAAWIGSALSMAWIGIRSPSYPAHRKFHRNVSRRNF